MDDSEATYDAIPNSRLHVCTHCGDTYFASRTDQRFCSGYCRLQHWRSRKSLQPEAASNDSERVETLLAEIRRLERQVAEVHRANLLLRHALKDAEWQLLVSQNRFGR
ncbi:hypothetical protein ACQPYH_22845 [Kribbella sp. CA-245084]|uniref:hypothetical protein n=1 Tax=Kribbella sp. CA-245084 TaxID=3239940 RepID=UPI003D8A4628